MNPILSQYSRILAIKGRLEEHLEHYARQQVGIDKKILTEMGVKRGWACPQAYRPVMHHDFIRLTCEGEFQLMLDARCGEPAEDLATWVFDPLILEGRQVEYEVQQREYWGCIAAQLERKQRAETEARRSELLAQLAKLNGAQS